MAFFKILVLMTSLCALSQARNVYRNTDSQQTEQSESAENTYKLPTYLELPDHKSAETPFYAPGEPSTVLTAPLFYNNPSSDYYEIPVPATDLTAPIETAVWNPEKDPKLYFEIPAALTRQETPTGHFPKKYNKDVHTKNKPSTFPKKEIELIPIEEKEFNLKRTSLEKSLNNLAKKGNQKELSKLRGQSAV